MDITDMPVDPQTTGDAAPSAMTTPGDMNIADCFDALSPTIEAMTLEEIDIVDSDFSWSTISSGPSTAALGASAPSAFVPIQEPVQEETTVVEGEAAAPTLAVSTEVQTEDIQEAPMQKHSLYFWESITFKVDGVMFQLPKYRFVEESEQFMRIFGGGEGGGPIDLDVSLGDFESFLKAFLPRESAMYDERPTLTAEEWISVLKLSTQWLFNDLRKLAISHLSSTKMDAIDRICLAKEYRVYNWLLEGYEQIVHRLLTFDAACGPQTILTTQEGKRIGMEVALELSGIVIRRMRWGERGGLLKDVTGDVLDAFKEEFDCVREEGKQFVTRSERMEEKARKKAEIEAAERWKEVEELTRRTAQELEREKSEEERDRQRVAKEEKDKMEDEEKARCLDEQAAKPLGEENAGQLEREGAGLGEESVLEATRGETQRAVVDDPEKQRGSKEAEKAFEGQAEEAKNEDEANEMERLKAVESSGPKKEKGKKKKVQKEEGTIVKQSEEQQRQFEAENAHRFGEATTKRLEEEAKQAEIRRQLQLGDERARRIQAEDQQRKQAIAEEQRLKTLAEEKERQRALADEQARQFEQRSLEEQARKEKQKMLERKQEMDRLLEEHNARQRILEEERAAKEAAKRGINLKKVKVPRGDEPWKSELEKYFPSG